MSMFYELMMRKKEEIMYATIKGTLTESPKGVFSGFSASNYLITQQTFPNNPNSFEAIIKFNTTSLSTNQTLFSGRTQTGPFQISLRTTGKIRFYFGGSSFDCNHIYSINTDYYVKVLYKLNIGVSIYYSTDGINWVLDRGPQLQSLTPISNRLLSIGINYGGTDNEPFVGTIDLNQTYLKINGVKYNLQAVVGYTIVGSPTITDGVASGFSASDYLTTNKTFPSDLAIANGFKFKTKFSVADLSTQQQVIQFYFRGTSDGVRISTTGRLDLFVGGAANVLSTPSGFIQPNQIYTVSGELTNGILNLYVDNVLIETKQFTDIVLQPQKNVYFGRIFADVDPSALSGTLYIAETNIEIGNELWFNGQSSAQ